MSTSKLELVFQDSSGKQRCVGFSHPAGLSGGETVEISSEDLAGVFQTAKSNGTSTLSGTGTSIDAAIEDPVSYHDYLILADGGVTFDTDWTRSQ